jgi:hypothetical protein
MKAILIHIEVYLAYSWNKLQAMVIASATFLLESGEYLHVGNTWRATDEFRKLTKITQEAVTSTYNSAAKFFGEDFPQSVPLLANGPCFFRTIEGLLWLWPLYVAYKSPGTSHIKHQWLQNTLVGIGQIGHIPKATSLVRNSIPISKLFINPNMVLSRLKMNTNVSITSSSVLQSLCLILDSLSPTLA